MMNKEAALFWGDVILTGINNVYIDAGTTGGVVVIPVDEGASSEAIS